MKMLVHYLIQLHGTLSGDMQNHLARAAIIEANLKHVEAVIKLLDPAVDVTKIAIKRRYRVNVEFRRGECARLVLEQMRDATEPMTPADLAMRLFALRGVERPSPHAYRAMMFNVRGALRQHEGATVRRVSGKKQVKWALIARD